MKPKYQYSIFIFRRDLRLVDNSGLIAALNLSEKVLPCFIIDPRQVGPKNSYRSSHALQFMFESLIELNKQLQKRKASLYVLEGKAEDCVEELLKELKPNAVFCTTDYTPFSTKRDQAIAKKCKAYDCDFVSYADLLLTQPQDIHTKTHKPYSTFTAFMRHATLITVEKPKTKLPGAFAARPSHKVSLASLYTRLVPAPQKLLHVHGGRHKGVALLKKIKHFTQYAQHRDFPHILTTSLSAHLKFGTLSVREVYHTIVKELGRKSVLLQQLYWRDYYTHIAFYYPHVFKGACQKKYDHLPWSNNLKAFKAWCEGKTGFPIVDAGMRQLNETGFMHNRVRMITASFLVKDLHLSWRLGEKYFAQKLVDYDPAVNNGNWQWVASTGCCCMPYFRVFNPWLQQKTYDPDCIYIKKWVPELRSIAKKIIHNLHKKILDQSLYPQPMVNHAQEAVRAKRLYSGS